MYFAVAKLGDKPTDGKTDVNPEGLTAGRQGDVCSGVGGGGVGRGGGKELVWGGAGNEGVMGERRRAEESASVCQYLSGLSRLSSHRWLHSATHCCRHPDLYTAALTTRV